MHNALAFDCRSLLAGDFARDLVADVLYRRQAGSYKLDKAVSMFGRLQNRP